MLAFWRLGMQGYLRKQFYKQMVVRQRPKVRFCRLLLLPWYMIWAGSGYDLGLATRFWCSFGEFFDLLPLLSGRCLLFITRRKVGCCLICKVICVASRSTQPFILPRSIKWVPGVSGNLVVKRKLSPRSGSSLEAIELHP